MKKIITLIVFLTLLLTGCEGLEESKPVTKIYTYQENAGDGMTYEEQWTLDGMDDDVLYKSTAIYTYTFDNVEEWADSIEELKQSLDKEIKDLQGPFGSPYIIIDYKLDGNVFVITETTDYKTASDEGKNVEGKLTGDLMTNEAYYSISKVSEELEGEGYSLVE